MMNHTYRCIIIDDEDDAVDLLKGMLQLLFTDLEITGIYKKWNEALIALQKTDADIVFLDISMPGKSGMELLKLVPDMEAEIIFVTAHEEHIKKSFDFRTSGYIVKPVDEMELLHSVHIAMQRIQKRTVPAYAPSPKIGIPDSKGITYVSVADIQYLEAVNGYTKVVMQNGEVLLTSFNLSKFKAIIVDNAFYQVHRSFIINLNAVARYKSIGCVVMKDSKEIPVAKTIRQHFLSLFETVSKGIS